MRNDSRYERSALGESRKAAQATARLLSPLLAKGYAVTTTHDRRSGGGTTYEARHKLLPGVVLRASGDALERRSAVADELSRLAESHDVRLLRLKVREHQAKFGGRR